MKKQKKSSKSQKIFIVTACIIGALLVIVIALLIAVLVRQNNPNKNYNSPTKTTTDETNKTPANETTEPITSAYISTERAIDIALENVGATREAVRDLDIGLDYEFGQKVYEVTFDYNQYEYDYYINPESGEIIKSFKEIDY